VCGSLGLDAGGESIACVAGWGEDGALDTIGDDAQTIDAIARQLEDARAAGAPDTARVLPAQASGAA
jgi:hypothetical protein